MSDVRLIDATMLEEAFAKECTTECPICSYYISDSEVDVECHCGLINNAPTVSFMISPDYVTELQNLNKELIKQIEELERPTGKWKFCEGVTTQGYLKCSICEYADFRKAHFNYCPNCGAKMKGGEEE